MPVVTDKKTRTSHTTKEMTKTDMREIKAVDSDLFLGIKYLRATDSSNNLLSFFEDDVAAEVGIVFLQLDPLCRVSFVLHSPIAIFGLGAFHFNLFACAFLRHIQVP
jgi:hypothetical protein